jgi:hypothetical protein
MDVQASPDVLPELKASLGRFQVRFRPQRGRNPRNVTRLHRKRKNLGGCSYGEKSPTGGRLAVDRLVMSDLRLDHRGRLG